jgi:hypothetical protein
MDLCALTRCRSRIQAPFARSNIVRTVQLPPLVIKVEDVQGLLPKLENGDDPRPAIERLAAEGRLGLISGEGAMGMDGVCDDFPPVGGEVE